LPAERDDTSKARPAAPVGLYSLHSPSPADPAMSGMPGLGPSGDDPSRKTNVVPLAGGSRSRVPVNPHGVTGAMLTLLRLPF
jgi:hypothetical protein